MSTNDCLPDAGEEMAQTSSSDQSGTELAFCSSQLYGETGWVENLSAVVGLSVRNVHEAGPGSVIDLRKVGV
jgi:hypothetical protein